MKLPDSQKDSAPTILVIIGLIIVVSTIGVAVYLFSDRSKVQTEVQQANDIQESEYDNRDYTY